MTVAVNAADRPERPNFIVINIDDLGYADIGPFGSKLNRTPHLDRMSAEGCRLKCFYAAPVCSPSRSALMTGCYPKRVLPIPGVLFPAGAVGLHPDEVTIAEVLKTRGYATGCIGKWHLGDQPEFLPTSQGFDSYLGIPYSNDMGPAPEGAKSGLGEPLPKSKGDPPTPALLAGHGGDETGLKANQQPPLPLLKDTRVIARVKPDEQQGIVQTYTTAAVEFITTNADRPFFLYLPHTAVHFPIWPGREWAGRSPHGYYSDWVEEVDWSVGQVLDALRAHGLAEKTLVLFTSDNGGTPRAVNTPLRGHKASTWEGGMRVPTLAWWPGQIPAGSSSDEVTGMIDVLPTLAGLAGAASVADRRLDGIDIFPILSGAAGAKGHEMFYFFRGLKLDAVRQGAWKLHLGTNAAPRRNAGQNALPQQPLLVNLSTDIGEAMNVYDQHPEVVAQLRKLVATMEADLGLDGVGPGCRELGRVKHPRPWINHDGTFREETTE
jgi:arylsulfatase A